jgi:hypothetical protein
MPVVGGHCQQQSAFVKPRLKLSVVESGKLGPRGTLLYVASVPESEENYIARLYA